MAIDRQVVWVTQQLTTLPLIYKGWNLVSAADKAVLDSNGVGHPGYDDERRRPHRLRLPPKAPA